MKVAEVILIPATNFDKRNILLNFFIFLVKGWFKDIKIYGIYKSREK